MQDDDFMVNYLSTCGIVDPGILSEVERQSVEEVYDDNYTVISIDDFLAYLTSEEVPECNSTL